MVKSNLIRIIGKLNSQEFKEFGEYVRSPLFNKNEGVIKLYDYVALLYPNFDEKKLEKEVIYGKLFPGVKYNENFMKTLIFSLTRLAEDFLSYLHYKKEPFEPETHLLRELYDRNIEGLFLKKLRNVEEELDKIKHKDGDFYLKKYNVQSIKEAYTIANQRFLNYKDLPGEDTYVQSESLLGFFFITILDQYRFLYNQKKIVNFDFKIEFLNKVIEYLRENYQKYNSPILELHFYELLLLKENNPSYFYKIKELFSKEKDRLSWIDKYSTLSILSNFTIEQYYSGNLSFLKERFELHKMILENKLYSPREDGGYFTELLFINMAVVGIQMKELEWTERFMEQYKQFLSPEEKDNTYYFCRSRLSLAKGKHEEALKFLSKLTSLNQAFNKTYVKNLTLMIYYELGWDVQALEVTDTYRHFLTRDNVLPPSQRERSVNFLKFYNDLLKLKAKNKSELSNKLRSELSGKYNVVERQWLLEKLDGL